MLELFRVETETQTAVLTSGLLAIERGAATAEQLESLMRAAHSLKGAARIVNLAVAVQIAHALEDCFVAAQQGRLVLQPAQTDVLLRGVDLLTSVSRCDAANPRRLQAWETKNRSEVKRILERLGDIVSAQHAPTRSPASATATHLSTASQTLSPPKESPSAVDQPADQKTDSLAAMSAGGEVALGQASAVPTDSVLDPAQPSGALEQAQADRVLRLAAENLNRLLGLAGESLVESRWLRPFSDSLQRLKRMQTEVEHALDGLRGSLADRRGATHPRSDVPPFGAAPHQDAASQETARLERIDEALRQTAAARQFLTNRLEELDLYERRTAHLTNRLYLEVLRARMRPFADGVSRFPRMVRDLARSLGKQVKLEIVGEETQVDRDILERLEAPLNHLLRNAVDHGCEKPEERERAGKPPEATVRLEARHSAGMLQVVVSDDGAGVDTFRVRRAITDRKLATPAIADKLNDTELLQFLFLPGFSLRETVTEISGRGVGLDVVQSMVKNVRGSVRFTSQTGRGTRFQLQLPLTLSVLRTLLVEIGGEPYAIPLAQIVSTLRLPREKVEALEGYYHFKLGGEQIGLLAAHQVLDCENPPPPPTDLPVVVLGESRETGRYGLLVDRFLGERELVVQPLDPRLGKIKDISAAALMEDGAPVLIVDVDDLVRSIEKLLTSGTLNPRAALADIGLAPAPRTRKRVLVVDDSLTVRELEKKLLASHGYVADVAVDGMDAWNAVRTGVYDLVITDVDMPRMDGIELATMLKRDPKLKSVPVMIVSYKDREADRLRGLEAGADYYLTKGSFHDEALLQAVQDLIGEPDQ